MTEQTKGAIAGPLTDERLRQVYEEGAYLGRDGYPSAFGAPSHDAGLRHLAAVVRELSKTVSEHGGAR